MKFSADENGAWHGSIAHYKADLTQLKASFEVVATKVTVGDAEQASGVTANDFSQPVTYRLYADDRQYREFRIILENTDRGTGTPLLAIFTENSKPVTSKEEWVSGRVVIDPQESDFERLDAEIEIKGRGNNTWGLPKKPYAIKLAEKNAVMGMNKHKRWVLLANAKDRTLLRNRVAFEIGRHSGLAWTPDSRFIEVILNGKYLGNYLLCEQIRVDKNRVNIDEMTAEDKTGEAITGGYLLELDRYYDEINKFRTALRDLPVNIKEPDEKVLGKEQMKYIADYVNHIEKLLYEGADIDLSYKEYLDIDSFIDWWIVMELTGCQDVRLPGSCYLYKPRSGKLCAGPIWDFDLMTFKAPGSQFLLYNYDLPDFVIGDGGDRSLWFAKLFTDPQFKARAGERWRMHKPEFDRIAEFIDAEAAQLESSAEVNWEMWELKTGPNGDEKSTWKESVELLRKNYLLRLQWMDTQVSGW